MASVSPLNVSLKQNESADKDNHYHNCRQELDLITPNVTVDKYGNEIPPIKFTIEDFDEDVIKTNPKINMLSVQKRLKSHAETYASAPWPTKKMHANNENDVYNENAEYNTAEDSKTKDVEQLQGLKRAQSKYIGNIRQERVLDAIKTIPINNELKNIHKALDVTKQEVPINNEPYSNAYLKDIFIQVIGCLLPYILICLLPVYYGFQ